MARPNDPLTAVERRLTMVLWMVGFLLALALGLFWQGFTIIGRLPQ